MKVQSLALHPVALQHAPLLHELYLRTPDYFSLLGTRPPSLGEVERDVQTALFDPRRCLELIYCESVMPGEPIGSLDYKLNFPEADDVTINLLLIRGDLQNSGLGQRVVRMLEVRLQATQRQTPQARDPHTQGASPRLLASVLGENPRAVAFWKRLGFHFATDARPVMTWYAKPLQAQMATPGLPNRDCPAHP